MGHDILIYTDHKIEAQFYDTLLKYIGANNPKVKPKESDKKNGVRILMAHANGKITKKQIKKWARTRLYLFSNAIIMDIDTSVSIYRALLSSLASMGDKTDQVRSLLNAYFNCIQNGNEEYSHRLTILEEIYRTIEKDALINANSNTMYVEFKDADKIL